ncbi:hypothetical protein JQX13_16820 [Archangium violaceum]|uniref:hypothetical protein n=1 Tax=Archangium violaceum TaxID=83451 RepID=UPI00193C5CCD|nr:hypothetical protein [Archangium violaceum]QRK11586.1 hypothetical protein JQX13_16820 [Archangium violaceum]
MRPIELCTAVLVTSGNRALREPAKVRWEAVEELTGLSLRPHSPFDSRVTMVDAGGEHLSFEEWLENRPASSARLWVAPFPQGSAFDTGGLGFLLYSDGERTERFAAREVRPPLYDISGPQLLAFIQGRQAASALTEVLARELDVPVEALARYLGARSPDEMQHVIQRFLSVGAELESSSADESWNAFFTPADSAPSPSFEFLYVGTGSEEDLERELDAARVSLAQALEAVLDFTRQQGLRSWSKHFRRALLRLSLEPQPLEDFVELLLLNSLPTPAIQLALCAASCEVSGGTGSWSSLHLALSNRLRASMKTALRVSLNRSAL